MFDSHMSRRALAVRLLKTTAQSGMGMVWYYESIECFGKSMYYVKQFILVVLM
jgi:hypothetical protein